MKNSRVLTCEQVRQFDRKAIDAWGVPSIVLMENAGRGVAETLLALDPELADHSAEASTGASPQVVVLCGKGNNGGDGFVAARHLEIRGVRSAAILLAAAEELQGDAATNLRILRHCQTPIVDLSSVDPPQLAERLDAWGVACRWLVDALLGTGAHGPPREPYASAIVWMNCQAARRLAVDLPSGLDADRGEAHDPTLRADATVTLAALKPGLVAPRAQAYVGELHVASIGVPLLDAR